MSEARELATPRMGLFDVSSHLRDFVITTYDVDPAVLARALPAGLEPDVFTLDSGRERGFVSAVTFLNTRFYVGFAPFLRLTVRQTNYRAYVRRGEDRVAWFFGTSLGTRLGLFVPRTVWQLPWAYVRGTHEGVWDDGRLTTLESSGVGPHGEERLSLEGTGTPMGRLDGFRDEAETQLVLTHPVTGYLRRRSGPVATYGVWHAPLELERARVKHARYALFEARGLVEPDAEPHSVLVQSLTHYLIFLPPRRAEGLV